MLAEIGQILLLISLGLGLLQGVFGIWGAHRLNGRMMSFADRSAQVQAVFLVSAFVILMLLFLASDFSVKLVAAHSHTDKPWLYKLSGTWGNHEGSMLLWVMIVALFGGAMSVFGQSLPSSLRARAIGVQGLLGTGFLGFLVFTSNPFERLSPIPMNGSGLNPLLQDPGLAFHPPFLYLGYVGFSVAFSFAIAALLEGRVDALWARFVRPWVLAAWSFLTIGIALGSLWAYYELGWGGWCSCPDPRTHRNDCRCATGNTGLCRSGVISPDGRTGMAGSSDCLVHYRLWLFCNPDTFGTPVAQISP